jgi:outer membrane biosynthesis protein TonB
MHRPSAAAYLAAWLLATLAAAADASDAIDRAKALLDQGEGREAAAALESALPAASAAERPELLKALRRAYDLAARQSEAAGQAREADAYRDNLRILNRKTVPAPPPLPEPEPAPAPERTAPEPPAADPPKAAEPPPAPVEAPRSAPTPAAELAPADAAFRAKRYDEAGRLYAALAAKGQLPASRRDPWAYCRWFAVVRRINAPPKDQAEWASIHAEIQEIQKLSPTNWFGEYLRNLVADLAPPARKAAPKAKARRVVVRGSAPDDPAPSAAPQPKVIELPRANNPPRRPAAAPKPAPAPAAPKEPAQARGPESSPASPLSLAPLPPMEAPPSARVGQAGARINNWQVWLTPSFRILHADQGLAERVAQVAETARDEQLRRWTGTAPRGPWSPRCDIYLYPSPELFHQMTGQPPDSDGFSTMGQDGGRVVARRINLRADHPDLIAAVLPHEVTHVVLADLFPDQPPPKWADEGIAVLSEPVALQERRVTPLAKALGAGPIFAVGDLMAIADYPDGRHWPLFFAQSVSLTKFLVERGTPDQFIRFLQAARRNGPDAELRRVYKIDGVADLQKRWLAHLRSGPSAAMADAPKDAALR